MPKRRIFNSRRPQRGSSFFGVVMLLALLGALVLVMYSPAHAPSHGGLHAQAAPATATPVAPTPVAAPPRLQPEARSSLIIVEERIPGTRIRYHIRPPPP